MPLDYHAALNIIEELIPTETRKFSWKRAISFAPGDLLLQALLIEIGLVIMGDTTGTQSKICAKLHNNNTRYICFSIVKNASLLGSFGPDDFLESEYLSDYNDWILINSINAHVTEIVENWAEGLSSTIIDDTNITLGLSYNITRELLGKIVNST